MHDGREYVSLASLAPSLIYRLDQEGLAVRLTALPEMLEKQRLELTPVQRPREMVLRKDTSAFLNYSVSGDSAGTFSGAAELGASVRGNLAFTGLNVTGAGPWVRGLSYVAVDDVPRMQRLVVGDAASASTALGGAGLLAGLSVTREFSLDPYFVRQPLPRLSGAVLTPSTLDLYVNGVLMREQQLAPGQFEVRNLPVPSGAGQVSYVVRDAFGRSQEYAAPYYQSSGVLADGISEYGYQLGLRRLNFGVDSFAYDWPEVLARHRFGLGNRLTAGYRFESALQHDGGFSLMASGGPTLALALPLGELDLDGALSADGSLGGAAASLSYSVFLQRLTAGVTARTMSTHYANVSQPAAQDRPLLQLFGSVGVPLVQRLSMSLEGQLESMRDAGLTSALSLRADVRLSKDLSLIVTGSRRRTPGAPPGFEAFATLLYNFGGGSTADAGGNLGAGNSASVGVQKSVPLGEGFGYQVRSSFQDGQDATGFGQVQYQGSYGTYLANYSRAGQSNAASGTAAGALVLVDGNVMASRPVQDGYALIQVPGVPGVRGFLNNTEIGRTDGRGNLLIPSLQSYYGNRLSIADADVPFELQLDANEQVIATPLRGGALVRFAVQRVQSVSGAVRIDGAVPAFGEMVVDGKLRSPLGGKGEFWFEGLPAGRHAAQAEFAGGACTFELEVPAGGNVDLGTVPCTRAVAATP
jgi:outer membrane usher protein